MSTTFPWRSAASRLVHAAVAATLTISTAAAAQPVVPGSGELVFEVGDDFEDPAWKYHYNNPKASVLNDGAGRTPGGGSANGRLVEPTYRGQPDVLQRVETPEGGLPDSAGSLLIRTMHSGIPGRPSGKREQDDLLVPVRSRLGTSIPPSANASCVVRVFIPPFEQWEQSTGSSFAFRADCRAPSKKKNGGLEEYWPGMFIQYESPRDRRIAAPRAYFLIRADQYGRDVRGPEITQLGWWTLGMSFTADGMVHYYAHAGVDDLTAEDHVASHYPYGFRNQQFELFFFNVCSVDNGRSWSTPWIIDDPRLYAERLPAVVVRRRATTPAPKKPAATTPGRPAPAASAPAGASPASPPKSKPAPASPSLTLEPGPLGPPVKPVPANPPKSASPPAAPPAPPKSASTDIPSWKTGF